MTTDTIMVRRDVDIIKYFKSKQSSFEANIVSISDESKNANMTSLNRLILWKSETPFDL